MIWSLLGCNDNHNPLLKSTFSAKNPEIRIVYHHHVYHHIPPDGRISCIRNVLCLVLTLACLHYEEYARLL